MGSLTAWCSTEKGWKEVFVVILLVIKEWY